jgi:uncharacterized membrane protein
MGVYHFVWDLGFFHLIPADAPYHPRFVLFGHVIAASFLTLAGVGLALAARGGFDRGAYLRRLAMIGAAALAISATTWLVFPDAFIAFGILHAIAVAGVIAAPFLFAPWPLAALAGAAMVAAPFFLASPAFDGSNWWLGLGETPPRTLDWRPVLPWAGFTLIGLAGARAWLAGGLPARVMDWRARGILGRGLVLAGRRSLLVYLVHQPVLLAIVFLASLALGAPRAPAVDDVAAFEGPCVAYCEAAGSSRARCEAACACVIVESRNAGLWTQAQTGKFTPQERARYEELTRACLRP